MPEIIFPLTGLAYFIAIVASVALWKFIPEDETETVSLEEMAPELFEDQPQ